MQVDLRKIRKEIYQRVPEGWGTIIPLLYQHYINDGPDSNKEVRRQYGIIEERLKDLPFSVRDKVLCAATAMCVEYEREAFSEGLLIGAKLMLELSEL